MLHLSLEWMVSELVGVLIAAICCRLSLLTVSIVMLLICCFVVPLHFVLGCSETENVVTAIRGLVFSRVCSLLGYEHSRPQSAIF